MNDQEMIAHHECDGGEEMNVVSRESIKRVANKLLEMEKNEGMYYCDFSRKSISRLHKLFVALLSVRKRAGTILVIDLYNACTAVNSLQSKLETFTFDGCFDDDYTSIKHATAYTMLLHSLEDIDRLCNGLNDFDMDLRWLMKNPVHRTEMDIMVGRCFDSILDCAKYIERLTYKLQEYVENKVRPDNSNLAYLENILEELEE
jgi:hypothetical protein